MTRHTRYQGAILQNHKILLIQHREHATGRRYWVLPGGGMDPGETEEECIVREMLEETNLTVQVERLIFEEPGHPDGAYKRRKTYLCRPVAGEAKPGFEPEPEAAANYSIVQVGWFDLRTMEDWDDLLRSDPFTYPQLEWLKELLGYTTASSEGQ